MARPGGGAACAGPPSAWTSFPSCSCEGGSEHGLELEDQEEFDDCDSVLLALALEPEILRRYPSFDSWGANPLFGLRDACVAALGSGHAFGEPRWLRQEMEVSMELHARPASRGSPQTVALGLPNRASHLALLAALRLEGVQARLRVHPDASVEAVARLGEVDLFWCRVDHSHRGAAMRLDQLRSAAARGAPAALAIPACLSAFGRLLSPRFGAQAPDDSCLSGCVLIPAQAEEAFGSEPRRSLGSWAGSADWLANVRSSLA